MPKGVSVFVLTFLAANHRVQRKLRSRSKTAPPECGLQLKRFPSNAVINRLPLSVEPCGEVIKNNTCAYFPSWH